MKKCKCPAGSPFHWWEGTSGFTRELNLGSVISVGSTRAVERARQGGRDPARVYGLSDKADLQIAMFGDIKRSLIKH